MDIVCVELEIHVCFRLEIHGYFSENLHVCFDWNSVEELCAKLYILRQIATCCRSCVGSSDVAFVVEICEMRFAANCDSLPNQFSQTSFRGAVSANQFSRASFANQFRGAVFANQTREQVFVAESDNKSFVQKRIKCY